MPLTPKEEKSASEHDLAKGLILFGIDVVGWNEAADRARLDPRWGKPDETFGVDYCAICKTLLTAWLDPEGKPAHPYCYENRGLVERRREELKAKRRTSS